MEIVCSVGDSSETYKAEVRLLLRDIAKEFRSAAMKEDKNEMREILESLPPGHATINEINKQDGLTLLCLSSMKGYVDCCQLLLDKGADATIAN